VPHLRSDKDNMTINIGVLDRWGEIDPKKDSRTLPIAKAVHSALSAIGAPFEFAPWNTGRIISGAHALQEWLPQASFPDSLLLSNAPLPPLLFRSVDTKSIGKRTRALKDLTTMAEFS
jgi:hypothetical protein